MGDGAVFVDLEDAKSTDVRDAWRGRNNGGDAIGSASPATAPHPCRISFPAAEVFFSSPYSYGHVLL